MPHVQRHEVLQRARAVARVHARLRGRELREQARGRRPPAPARRDEARARGARRRRPAAVIAAITAASTTSSPEPSFAAITAGSSAASPASARRPSLPPPSHPPSLSRETDSAAARQGQIEEALERIKEAVTI